MNFELVEKEKLVGKLSQGVEYYKGERGPKGDKGEAFKYEDFTPEQLEQLRGPKGDDGFIKFEELTPEQKEQLRGPAGKDGKDGKDGKAFTYEDFTQEQLNALKGPQGEPGVKGDKGDAFTYADFTQEQLEALRGPQGIQGVPGETGPAGQPGQDGKDGKSFTYEDFTVEQLEALRGPQGEPGKDGSNGLDGKDGKDGISVSHTWNGTSLSITSASGTSEMDLRGPIGPAGQDGQDYVLTQNDKTEIAGLVDLTNYATTTYVDNAVANIEIPEVIKHISITDINQLLNLETGFYYIDDGFMYGTGLYLGILVANKEQNTFTSLETLYQFEYSGGEWTSYSFVYTDEYLETVNRINAIESAGFQTEEQVNTLINQALGVIENGTY